MNALEIASLKAEAKIMLVGGGPRRVSIPTQREMVGLALLERDDELPPRKSSQGSFSPRTTSREK